ncbi:hypothetical protein [Cerasicoccus frondis]|uniref:hypothetical protein n=1 Tax=Cerasicoccus frondis TaxID=490090 RepID=UPI002852D895|nr:hypothetical protein [Cerasicoccus frondis]
MGKLKLIPKERQPDAGKAAAEHITGRRMRDIHARRKASNRFKHALMGVWGKFMSLLGFLLFAGLAYGIYHVATNWDTVSLDSFIPVGSYSVQRKEIVPGYVVTKEMRIGHPQREFSDWVDPRFLFTCKSDVINQIVFFEVPESEYRTYGIGNKVDKGDTSHWKRMSKEGYEAAFKKPVAEEAAPQKQGITIELPVLNLPE